MIFGFNKRTVPTVAASIAISMFFVLSAHAQEETKPLTGAKRNEIGKQVLKTKKPDDDKADSGKSGVKTKSATALTSESRSEAERTIMNALDFKTFALEIDGDEVEYTHVRGKISGCKVVVTETVKVEGYPTRAHIRYTLDLSDVLDLDVAQPDEGLFALIISTGSPVMQEVADNQDFRSSSREELEAPIIFTSTFEELEAVALAVATLVDSCR